MNGFLHLLLRRERGAPDARAIVPRLPSRFEPDARGATLAAPDETDPIETADIERRTDDGARHAPASATFTASAAGPPTDGYWRSAAPPASEMAPHRGHAPPPEAAAAREDGPVRAAYEPETAAAPPPFAGVPERGAAMRRPLAVQPGTAVPTVRAATSETAAPMPPDEDETRVPAPALAATEAPPRKATKAVARAANAERRHAGVLQAVVMTRNAHADEMRTDQTGAAASDGNPAAQHRAGARGDLRPAMAAPAAAPKSNAAPRREIAAPRPAASVHITIGRVEVRAVATPPVSAPMRTRSAPQPMSLDEYLERRNRRGTP
ncbi:MAG TPA: hypothetical protein VEC06_19970 [Paucimonas sp.]|nr:hypothetical protein [Paucimonas sp.]